MIGYLNGRVLPHSPCFNTASNDSTLLLDVNGVGYEVLATSRFSQTLAPNQTIELHIYTHVREEALMLFGFESVWEKRVFLTLISVSGVGPRTGMGIMGGLEAEALLTAIVQGDKSMLSTVPGIGKKTAERLIVELQDKAQKMLFEKDIKIAALANPRSTVPAQGATSHSGMMSEAIAALVGLGYRENEAWKIVRETMNESDKEPTLSDLIRSSLQRMAAK